MSFSKILDMHGRIHIGLQNKGYNSATRDFGLLDSLLFWFLDSVSALFIATLVLSSPSGSLIPQDDKMT